MRKQEQKQPADDNSVTNNQLGGLPPELWIRVLRTLPLHELWNTARPVCNFWDVTAVEIARSLFYKGSKCELSTLVAEEDGFKHYERARLPVASGTERQDRRFEIASQRGHKSSSTPVTGMAAGWHQHS